MNNIQIFKNKEFGEVRTVTINNEVWFVGKDVASALSYTNPQKAIRDHIDEEDKTLNDSFTVNGTKGVLINESGLYSLVLSSKLPNAKKFKRWITSEVLPSIRKTGGYVNNEKMFVETYLPFADDTIKLLFSQTLNVIKQQNGLIEKQKDELKHKQQLIDGLTDDIDVYTKRIIVNRICKRTNCNYGSRYKELYKCYKETYHIDLELRCKRYNIKQTRKKDELSVVAYAEKFNHINDLYSCCVKLYETEVKEIIKRLQLVKVC